VIGSSFSSNVETSGKISNLFRKWAHGLQPSKEFKHVNNLIGLLWGYLHI